jgi:hypothetical protein
MDVMIKIAKNTFVIFFILPKIIDNHEILTISSPECIQKKSCVSTSK